MKALYAQLLAWLLAPVLKPLEARVQALESAETERIVEYGTMSLRVDAVVDQANQLADALTREAQARRIG